LQLFEALSLRVKEADFLRQEILVHGIGVRKMRWLQQPLVEALQKECGNAESPFYSVHIYSEMLQGALKRGVIPKSVLEIGPGASLGSMLCFAAMGCQRVAGVELSKLNKPSDDFLLCLKIYLACAGGFQWWRSYAAASDFSTVEFPLLWDNEDLHELVKGVELRDGTPLHEMPFADNTFNFAYSIAVLEHLDKPEEGIRKLFSVMCPGGITIHEIDLRDHQELANDGLSKTHPLGFLRLTDEEYANSAVEGYSVERSLSSRIGSGGWGRRGVRCNRLRRDDWEELFRTAGFREVSTEVICRVKHNTFDRSKFAEPFRSKSVEQLADVVIRLSAKKYE
jgi:SAM-dependent methyltransferase